MSRRARPGHTRRPRYLDGHAALFPDGVQQWAERLRLAEELAVMADRLAELDGAPPAAPLDPDAVSTRAAVVVADLVEPARSTALDMLDEARQALTIATSWLRSGATSISLPLGDLARSEPVVIPVAVDQSAALVALVPVGPMTRWSMSPPPPGIVLPSPLASQAWPRRFKP